jgi:hypothetical protein
LTQTTRRLRESSVLIVDSHIPDGMTIADYRRNRSERENEGRTRRATSVVTRLLEVRGPAASR